MRRKRRKFSPEFKLKVILEALRERLSLAEMAQKFELHPNQISKWKTDFIENAKDNLKPRSEVEKDDSSHELNELYSKIGRLQMENDFLKKKLP